MKLTKEMMKLYAVTDRRWLDKITLEEIVEEALKSGVTFLQLREKKLSQKEFLEEAIKIRKISNRYHIPFVINDNVEIAIASGADGVHVGQSDIKSRDIRSLIGSERILGISANTVETAKKAEQNGADYLGVGAVFPTKTKKDAKGISVEELREICEAVTIPVVAIGGIDENTVMKLKGSKIDGICVISAIFSKSDIEKATKKLRSLVEKIVI